MGSAAGWPTCLGLTRCDHGETKPKMATRTLSLTLPLALLACLCGCPGEYFPNSSDAVQGQVTQILSDGDLTAAQQREALEELGLGNEAINLLLDNERLANQDGGDLGSAYDKVVGGALASMTPDELQHYADAGDTAAGLGLNLGDTNAALIARILSENGLNTADQVSNYLADPTGPTSVSPVADIVQALLVDLDPLDSALVNQLP